MFLFNPIWSELIFLVCKELHVFVLWQKLWVLTSWLGDKSSESVRSLISLQEMNRRLDAGSESENEVLF